MKSDITVQTGSSLLQPALNTPPGPGTPAGTSSWGTAGTGPGGRGGRRVRTGAAGLGDCPAVEVTGGRVELQLTVGEAGVHPPGQDQQAGQPAECET